MAVRVEDIRPGFDDYACNRILCIYAYNPPDYAVYRTSARVMVHFADDRAKARRQRQALRDVTALRGEINGLIDGWHDPALASGGDGGTGPSLRDRLFWWRRSAREQLYKRAVRYDRRVADAIVTALEGDETTAERLLAEVKNDIISERTSIARWSYLALASALVLALLLLLALLSGQFGTMPLQFGPDANQVWTAACGGTVGAFFSIAIGLKGRTVLIDLQNRDNMADAILRILIGTISGGVLMCLLVSGLLANSLVNNESLKPGHEDYSVLTIFIIGFIGGFFERLVPDFLAQTNIGTKEKTADRPPAGTPASPAPPAVADPLGGPEAVAREPDSDSPAMDLGLAGASAAGAEPQDGSGTSASSKGSVKGAEATAEASAEPPAEQGAAGRDTPPR